MRPGFQFAWFIKLCRERGKKVIFFDPKYTPAQPCWRSVDPDQAGDRLRHVYGPGQCLFKTDRWDKELLHDMLNQKASKYTGTM